MPNGHPEAVRLGDLRIAFFTDNGIVPADPETVAVVQQAAAAIASEVQVMDERRPPGIEESYEHEMRLIGPDGGDGLRAYLEHIGSTRTHPLLDGWLAKLEPYRTDVAGSPNTGRIWIDSAPDARVPGTLRRDSLAGLRSRCATAWQLDRGTHVSGIQLYDDVQPYRLAGRRGSLRTDRVGLADRRADCGAPLARRRGATNRRPAGGVVRRVGAQPAGVRLSNDIPLDPVAAYDRIAPVFARLAEQRKPYLDRIDQLVISEMPPGSRSMLDVGSGDGARARRIAQTRGSRSLCCWSQAWRCRATATRTPRCGRCGPKNFTRFKPSLTSSPVSGMSSDTFSLDSRMEMLRQFARLVSPHGRIFVDVNHRYNARHYGSLKTALRRPPRPACPGTRRMATLWLPGMSVKRGARPGGMSLPTRNSGRLPSPPA